MELKLIHINEMGPWNLMTAAAIVKLLMHIPRNGNYAYLLVQFCTVNTKQYNTIKWQHNTSSNV